MRKIAIKNLSKKQYLAFLDVMDRSFLDSGTKNPFTSLQEAVLHKWYFKKWNAKFIPLKKMYSFSLDMDVAIAFALYFNDNTVKSLSHYESLIIITIRETVIQLLA